MTTELPADKEGEGLYPCPWYRASLLTGAQCPPNCWRHASKDIGSISRHLRTKHQGLSGEISRPPRSKMRPQERYDFYYDISLKAQQESKNTYGAMAVSGIPNINPPTGPQFQLHQPMSISTFNSLNRNPMALNRTQPLQVLGTREMTEDSVPQAYHAPLAHTPTGSQSYRNIVLPINQLLPPSLGYDLQHPQVTIPGSIMPALNPYPRLLSRQSPLEPLPSFPPNPPSTYFLPQTPLIAAHTQQHGIMYNASTSLPSDPALPSLPGYTTKNSIPTAPVEKPTQWEPCACPCHSLEKEDGFCNNCEKFETEFVGGGRYLTRHYSCCNFPI